MFVTFPFAKSFDENTTTFTTKKNVVVNKKEQKIFDIIVDNQKATADTIALELGVTARTAQRHLKVLQEKKLIKRVGSDKTGYWEIITN